jgi:hypothetical protein
LLDKKKRQENEPRREILRDPARFSIWIVATFSQFTRFERHRPSCRNQSTVMNPINKSDPAVPDTPDTTTDVRLFDAFATRVRERTT